LILRAAYFLQLLSQLSVTGFARPDFQLGFFRGGARDLLAQQTALDLFGLAPRGEIARDFGKSDERSSIVAQRGDDDVRPKPRAVLSNAPPLVLEPPFAANAA
jgi:hypothetical protein